MLRSRVSICIILMAALGAYGCSNVKPAADSGEGAPAGEVSQADSVGSIPEDLLANEEKKDEAAAEGEKAEGEKKDDGASPFNELSEKDGAGSMAVIEDGDSKPHSSGEMETYTVKSGDTLMKVAFTIYGDIDRWKDLQNWNQSSLKNKSALRKGMKLKYEAPAVAFSVDQHEHSYEIKKGDTLAGIADEVYGRKAKYKKLQGYNSHLIRNPNRIFAGFTIFYDITAKEVAEAEARRKERMAKNSEPAAISPMDSAPPPSAISPPDLHVNTNSAPIAVGPSAPGPASASPPPAPPADGLVPPPPAP